MNEDDRVAAYLNERAQSLDLAPNDLMNITTRAQRRRRARRAIGAAAAVVVLAGGTLAIVTRSPGRDSVHVASVPDASRAPLTWSAVDVPDGLGWSLGTVAAADGSLFSLSTAPGPQPTGPTTAEQQRAVLYHSTDGRAWDLVALPGDLSPSGLATGDGQLYAVGTAPGGGAVDIVIASSRDGAKTWSETRIPQPAADVKARFPNEVHISAPHVASGPGGLVAAVTVSALPEVDRLLPPDVPEWSGWQYTATGIELFSPIAKTVDNGCVDWMTEASAPPPESSESATTLAPTSSECVRGEPEVVASYTWDELGLEPELQALIGGQLHLYTAADGSSFAEVSVPDLPGGQIAVLLGADDGYRMLVSSLQSSVLHPLYSADGRSWAVSGNDLSGWARASGLLAGRPAVVVDADRAGSVGLLTAATGGGWTSSDISAGGADQWVQDVAIGPLGVVALVGDGTTVSVIESADGQTFTHHAVGELLGDGQWISSGITMNADAVIVRMMPPAAPFDPNATTQPPPGPQRLLVGIPA